MQLRPVALAFALAALSTTPAAIAQRSAPEATAAAPGLEQIMADPEWIGPQVEAPFWSHDGRHAYFQLERAGSALRDTWVVDIASGDSRRVEDAALATLDAAAPVYDAKRERMAFVRNGDVFVRTLQDGALRQLTRSEALETGVMFMRDGNVAWQADGTWYVHRRDSGVAAPVALLKFEKDPAAPTDDYLEKMQLRLIGTLARDKADADAAREREQALRALDPTRTPTPFYLGDKREPGNSALSPDGRWLLLATQAKGAEAGRVGKMPKYVTTTGYNEIEDVRTRVGRNAPIPQQLLLLDLREHTVHELSLDVLPGIAQDPLAELRAAQELPALEGKRPLRINGVQWNRDGSRVAIQLRSIDNKDRWLASVDFDDKALVPLHRLTDPAWINWNFNDFGWLHDDRTLWLLSEQDGYSHLYLLQGSGAPRQLTDGEWEVSQPQLSADGRTLYFLCNRAWPGDYEVCAKDLARGAVRELSALDGVESFALSPDGERLLLAYSRSYLPMQLAVVDVGGGDARVLTDTRTDAYKAIEWQPPQIVQVPSSHVDRPLWSKLYTPAQMQPGKRYPVVLFVHGAGYTQNTHARFPYYFREQMFHNLLAQQGYIVLDIDYRASEGYGRDWRTAIYRQMGTPELQDLLDGIDWLVESKQADRGRVGVYGGSYGGFMTFMAMFRAPAAFAAGAALRPVTDWAMYNHEYTSNILNTPELDPEAYQVSSPIEYAEALQGRLLIAHGMLDDNVFYQDSVRLAQRLIELEKTGWELASYPLERHSFVHPESWLDEYRRIHALFEETLKP